MYNSNVDIVVYKTATSPPALISFPSVDLTGSVIELSIYPAPDATPIVVSPLVIGAHQISWPYTDDIAGLPIKTRLNVDIWRLLAGEREKIGAARLYVAGPGEFLTSAPAVVEMPGIQGPPGDSGASTADAVTYSSAYPTVKAALDAILAGVAPIVDDPAADDMLLLLRADGSLARVTLATLGIETGPVAPAGQAFAAAVGALLTDASGVHITIPEAA